MGCQNEPICMSTQGRITYALGRTGLRVPTSSVALPARIMGARSGPSSLHFKSQPPRRVHVTKATSRGKHVRTRSPRDMPLR